MKLVIAEKPSVAQSIARVMTPTLGMAVMREAEIQAFKPEIFYEVELHFSGISAKSDRIKERSDAEKAAEACRNGGKAEVISSVRREKTEKPPALYDLTSLQRDANRILGFTAQQTLDYTQSLYEKKSKINAKTFRMSLGSDTTELTLFGCSTIIYYVIVYYSVSNISKKSGRAECSTCQQKKLQINGEFRIAAFKFSVIRIVFRE